MPQYLAVYSLEVLGEPNAEHPEEYITCIQKYFGINASNKNNAKTLAKKAKSGLERFFLHSSKGTIVGTSLFSEKDSTSERMRETGHTYKKVLSIKLSDIFELKRISIK